MFLVKLAATNVWRRLSHSLLIIISMAAAAMLLVSSMSVSKGVARQAYQEYRDYLQGDVVVFSPNFIGASPMASLNQRVVRRTLMDTGFNLLLRFYPDFATKGYFASEDWVYTAITPNILDGLANTEGVAGVTPHLALPATCEGVPVSLRTTPSGYEKYISKGEALNSEGKEIEVIVNGYGCLPTVRVGDLVNIMVPAYGSDKYGVPYVDSSIPQTTYRARVAGVVSWPTRKACYPSGVGEWNKSEQGYVHASEIYLNEQAWANIWSNQSGGQSYHPTAVSLTINNMESVFALTQSLRELYPQLAVFDVPHLATHAERYGLLDHFYEAPNIWNGAPVPEYPFAGQDVKFLTGLMLFLCAGVVMASQTYSAVCARRKEIGALKAIGARNSEVVLVIVVEAIILAVSGGLSGVFFVQLVKLHQALTNGVVSFILVSQAFSEMLLVLAITIGISIIAGILPAWRVTRLTVMGVLGNE